MFVSHFLTSVLGLLFFNVFFELSGPEFLAGIILTSLLAGLPDLDSQHSRISRKHKKTSWLVRRFTKHRGALHSPFVLLVLACFLALPSLLLTDDIVKWVLLISIPLQLHAFTDFLAEKTSILYPLTRKKFGLGVFRTGSKSEKVFVDFIIILSLGFFFYLDKWFELTILLLTWLLTLPKQKFVFSKRKRIKK